MTKKVRIENADNSNYKLIVQVWEVREDGNHLTETKMLTNPTDLVECTVWKNRFLVVREQ
jgi:hypothetical protein